MRAPIRSLSLISVLLAAAAAAAGPACGGESSNVDSSERPPSDEPPVPARDASTSDVTSPQPDATTETSTPPSNPAFGEIAVAQNISYFKGNRFVSVFASARWFAEPGAQAATCTQSTLAGCRVTECDPAATLTLPNAGTVTLTGGALPPLGLLLTPTGPNSQYIGATLNQDKFTAGDVLSVSAAGDSVPAFAGITVSVPPDDLNVTSPQGGPAHRYVINRAVDYAIAWTGASSAMVSVTVKTIRKVGRTVEVECTAPGAAGGLSVPIAALARLDALVINSVDGSLAIAPYNETTFMAGSVPTTFRVRVSAVTGFLGGFWNEPPAM